MSQETVNFIRAIVEAHGRGDYSASDWAHPDIEYEIVGGPSPGRWKGRTAMASAAGELFRAWEQHRSVVEEVRALDGERVLVLSHISARGRTSGIELPENQSKVAALYEIRDGIVIRSVVYFDRASAFTDLGLKE